MPLTIVGLHYDILRRQFQVRFVFQIVVKVLDAMTVQYEEAVEWCLRAAERR